MYKIEKEKEIKQPLSVVFDYFNTPKNLAEITPKYFSFNILTPDPLIMKEGAVFDYKIKLFGLPSRWTTLIEHYDPPYKFTDIQLKGPYSFWHHQHIFEEKSGVTVMKDIVNYEMPFGLLGKLPYYTGVKKINESIFEYRDMVIDQIFNFPEK